MYALTSDHSEEGIDEFHEQLQTARRQTSSQSFVMVKGNLNAKVEVGSFEHPVGHLSLGVRNEMGDR